MSQEFSFWRKVVYVGAIVLLLFPLFWIGQPATPKSAGGVLAQQRTKSGLSQASLGEIDPAGESIKLATLGLRPWAVWALWDKSFEYKKKEDWDGLSASLNQITKLQPNFITVWEHQSHNLAYNVSVEFDDYRMRYHWVTKGIEFLVNGVHYNRNNPRLLHYTGWIMGQKIGRADEHVQFRELFRKDEDFHNSLNNELRADALSKDLTIDTAHGWDGRPDNWLVSRLWYQRAERAVDSGILLKGKSPLIFHADNPMALINYSSTIEDEGVLGQTAQRSWYEAGEALKEYGRRPIPTSWGHNVQLGAYDQVNDGILRMGDRLEKLAPGVREQIRKEKTAKLTPELAAALDVPQEKLTEDNYRQHFEAVAKTNVTHQEVAQRAPQQNREAAELLAKRLVDEETLSSRISHYRSIVNFEYWTIRCTAEQTKTAVDAREFLYKAQQKYDAAELMDARKLFESSWVAWRKIFDEYPRLLDDISADELAEPIKKYQRLLDQLDAELPADFPLAVVLKMRQDRDAGLKEMYRKIGTPLPGMEEKPPPETPKEAAKEMPKQISKEAPKEMTKEAPKEMTKETPKEASKEASKAAAEEAKSAPVQPKPASEPVKSEP